MRFLPIFTQNVHKIYTKKTAILGGLDAFQKKFAQNGVTPYGVMGESHFPIDILWFKHPIERCRRVNLQMRPPIRAIVVFSPQPTLN